MRTKLLITTLIAAAMTLTLCACSQQATSSSAAASSAAASAEASQPSADGPFATLGDVFASDHSDFLSIYDDSSYTCVFDFDGKYYRVSADLSKEIYDKLQAGNGSLATEEEVLGPVAVTKTETIDEDIPTQEELDALAGKTGAELLDAGYVIDDLSVNGNETDCSATKGSFAYMITFKGAVENVGTDDPAGAVADKTATAVSFSGLSSEALRSAE